MTTRRRGGTWRLRPRSRFHPYALHILQGAHLRSTDPALVAKLAGAAVVVVNPTLDPADCRRACPDAILLPSFNAHMMFAGGQNQPEWQEFRASFTDADFYPGRPGGPDYPQNPEYRRSLDTAERLAWAIARHAIREWGGCCYLDDCWEEEPRRYLEALASYRGAHAASAWCSYRAHLVSALRDVRVEVWGNVGAGKPDPHLHSFSVESQHKNEENMVRTAVDFASPESNPEDSIYWGGTLSVRGLVMPGEFLPTET